MLSLSDDGSRIYMQDPWLARDYSYEMGSPHNARFQSESISASGSQVFIINRYGDMYTRLYDFDISGSDPAQFRYTWGDDPRPTADNALSHRLDPRTAPIGLPADDWHMQPKIPGEITDRISIHNTGVGTNNRELRVEGLNEAGETGYWHKELNDDSWQFTPTHEPIRGTQLENSSEDRSLDTLAAPTPYNYEGELADGVNLEIREFDFAPPKRDVTIDVEGQEYPLVLHTIDGRQNTALSMRQLPLDNNPYGRRPAGLVEDVPRNMYGAFELPGETREATTSDPALADFVDDYFPDGDFHEVTMQVTPNTMEFSDGTVLEHVD